MAPVAEGSLPAWRWRVTTRAPARARTWTRAQLTSWRPNAHAEDTALLVSELITNAVRHAPAGGIDLELELRDNELTATVTGPGAAKARLTPRAPATTPSPAAASRWSKRSASAGEPARPPPARRSGPPSPSPRARDDRARPSHRPGLGRPHASPRRTHRRGNRLPASSAVTTGLASSARRTPSSPSIPNPSGPSTGPGTPSSAATSTAWSSSAARRPGTVVTTAPSSNLCSSNLRQGTPPSDTFVPGTAAATTVLRCTPLYARHDSPQLPPRQQLGIRSAAPEAIGQLRPTSEFQACTETPDRTEARCPE
jgi:hypothetical protein